MKDNCNCGRSTKKEERNFCVDGKNYKSRSPCLHAKRSCKNCHCLNCDNPFGAQEKRENQKATRLRQPSQISTKRASSLDFLEEIGENPKDKAWTDVETIMFVFISEVWNIDEIPELTLQFNKYANILKKAKFQIDLKSEKSIQCKILSEGAKKTYFNSLLQVVG